MRQHLIVLAVCLSFNLAVIGADNSSITTESLVLKQGYPIETHTVTTNDGYILTMHRIPYSPLTPSNKPKKAVFIMHGLLCSSSDFIVAGPNRAIAYLLSDAGYDVWLGNARGNIYSSKHVRLDPNSVEFWDFEWHEIGMIDTPAMIEYILEQTGLKKLDYVGHSQGVTSFLVLSSLNPDFNKYIESAHMLAPAAFLGHLTAPFYKYAAILFGHPTTLFPIDLFVNYKLNPSKKLMEIVAPIMCDPNRVDYELCTNILFLAIGFDENTVDDRILDDVMKSNPAGSSTKQLLYYLQGYSSGYFRQFDYGTARNLIKYGQTKPPNYPLANIDVPIYLYYGESDSVVAVKDVKILISKLQSLVMAYKVKDPKFDHMGHLYNSRAKTLVYDILLKNLLTNTTTGRT